VSGDRLIPDLANEPPPEREDDDRERPRPERPPSPWAPPPQGSQPPPPPPPAAAPPGQLPPPPAPQPFDQPTSEHLPYPYEKRGEDRDDHEPTTPYTSRFQLILGALLGIAAVAIVAAVLVGTGPKSAGSSDWSGWSPNSDDRGDAAQEIANHVAPTYRLDKGGQLVAVTGGKLEVAELPARLAVADPANGNVSVLNGDGVLYTMCGLGPKCSINSGEPSTARHLLLRREALELALYTFRYEKGTDYVVALLPPKKGDNPTQAMFFTRDDLEAQLDRPLTRTLPAPPPTSQNLNAAEVTTLESLTQKRLFAFKFEQGQDASVFLVLSPFAG
jgi:hypothetical protein